jgi:hypothetical protein
LLGCSAGEAWFNVQEISRGTVPGTTWLEGFVVTPLTLKRTNAGFLIGQFALIGSITPADPLLVGGKDLAMCAAIYRTYFDRELPHDELIDHLIAGTIFSGVVVGSAYMLNSDVPKKAQALAGALGLPTPVAKAVMTMTPCLALGIAWMSYVDGLYRRTEILPAPETATPVVSSANRAPTGPDISPPIGWIDAPANQVSGLGGRKHADTAGLRSTDVSPEHKDPFEPFRKA